MASNPGSTELPRETFCVFHVDEAGHVLSVDELKADNDRAAIDHAHRRYHCQPGTGIEIWRGDRRVYARLEPKASHH
jgi:hypothetical protein